MVPFQGCVVISRDHHDVSGTDRYLTKCPLLFWLIWGIIVRTDLHFVMKKLYL